MFHRSILPILLVACNPAGHDSEPPPVDDTGEPDPTGLGARAQDLLLALLMPMELPGLTTGLAHFSSNGCPEVVQSEDALVLVGDCAWDQGELEGSVSFGQTEIVWDAWSMSFGDGTVVAVDGQQVLRTDGAMVSDLLVEADVRQVPLLPAGQDRYTFTAHRLDDWDAWATGASPAAVALSGTMALDSLGPFALGGGFEDDGACPKFWDRVDLRLEGSDALTIGSDPDPCDLCFHWVEDQGGEGDFCLGVGGGR